MIAPISLDGAGPMADGAAGTIPVLQVMPTMRDELAASAAAGDPSGFETTMIRAVNGLSDTLRTSDRLSELAASGELADPTVAILAAEEADLSLQMATQVRNRLLTAWSTINQMSV
jgi:flagellar hook-basal body complex protein FliE